MTRAQPVHAVAGLHLEIETEAALLCVRAEQGGAQLERLREVVSDAAFDWGQFWGIVEEQQVLPLVAVALGSPALTSALPPACVQDIRTIREQVALHNLAAHAELLRIAGALQARGVPVVPLKGTHLAERAYGQMVARQAGDIDILVPETQVEDGKLGLGDLGYDLTTPSPDQADHTFHAGPFVRTTTAASFATELHWHLSDRRFVSIDYPALWTRVFGFSPPNARLRPLPGEELLLFLALHMFKHDSGWLRLLADIDRLVRAEGSAMDWPYLVDLARRWRVAGMLCFALEACQVLLETEIPAATMRLLKPGVGRRLLVHSLVGPGAMLRPGSGHQQYNRSRLAYCLMLSPLSRCFQAYACYLFPGRVPRRPGVLGGALDLGERLARGCGRTGLVVGSALVGR